MYTYFYILMHIFVSALLRGDVKMSAERRLTIQSLPDSEKTSANNIDNIDQLKSKMMKIINIAKAGNGLENL